MVVWSGPARSDLREIHDFIARDSHAYAQMVIEEIIEKTGILDEFPQIGRIVPELETESVREIFAYSYRIIYEIKPDRLVILSVLHARRLLNME
jgi:plasmid stabilization system protein ParE